MAKRSQEQVSFNMSRIKSRDTSIEKLLKKSLRKQHIHFRTNLKQIFGTPDFVIRDARVAIFCDSAFWHGYKFKRTKRHNFKTHKVFWENKIQNNIRRDKVVNSRLKAQGWKVFRFWDFELTNNAANCIIQVKKAIVSRGENRRRPK